MTTKREKKRYLKKPKKGCNKIYSKHPLYTQRLKMTQLWEGHCSFFFLCWRHWHFPSWANTVLQCPRFKLGYFSNNKLYQQGMCGCFLWACNTALKHLMCWTVGDFEVIHEWVFFMWLLQTCDLRFCMAMRMVMLIFSNESLLRHTDIQANVLLGSPDWSQ